MCCIVGDVDLSEARRALHADDTAVIQEAAERLVYARDAACMAVVCEALADIDADADLEAGETMLWVLSPAWTSGDVDVPSLLAEVEVSGSEAARRGADEALRWLGLRGST
jgi:hypothetical protein